VPRETAIYANKASACKPAQSVRNPAWGIKEKRRKEYRRYMKPNLRESRQKNKVHAAVRRAKKNGSRKQTVGGRAPRFFRSRHASCAIHSSPGINQSSALSPYAQNRHRHIPARRPPPGVRPAPSFAPPVPDHTAGRPAELMRHHSAEDDATSPLSNREGVATRPRQGQPPVAHACHHAERDVIMMQT